MKALAIGTAFILIMPMASFASASLSSAPYRGKVDGANTKLCQSTPIAEPSGGATRQRLQALQHCNTKIQQFSRESNKEVYQAPTAEPSGRATRQRFPGRQR